MTTKKSPCLNTGNSKNPDQHFTNSDRPGKGFNKEEIRQSAKGRWKEILSSFGIDCSFLDGKHHPCPSCGGKDRFRFDDKDGNGTYICNECGAGNGFSMVGKLLNLDSVKDFPVILKAIAEKLGIQNMPVANSIQAHPPIQGKIEQAVPTANATQKAQQVWDKSTPVGNDHPYLAGKGVGAVATIREIDLGKLISVLSYPPKGKDGPLQGERILIIPIKVDDKVSTIEMIDGGGRKTALAGGKKAGGYWATGNLPEGDGMDLVFLVGEGVATVLIGAMAVPEAIGVAALMNSNLPAVARILRDRYPTARITILADVQKSDGAPDKYAVEAAKAVGGLLAIPYFGPNRQEKETDFNDLCRVSGLDVVRQTIRAAQDMGKAAREQDLRPGPLFGPRPGNDDPSQGITNRRGFFLTPVNDLLEEPTTTRWLIPKILPTNCLAMLVGDPAAGKSFLALDWSVRIASVVPQTVFSVSGPVVYIAGEGQHGIKKRLKGWFLHHDVSSENVPLFVSSTGTSLDTGEGLADVELALDEVAEDFGKPKLIIIDTLHRNMQGDENSSQDVGLVIKAADQLRVRYEAAVLVVHHSGHMDKSRGRGSSSLRAAVDVELLLSVKGNVRTLRCSKMKDSEPFQPCDYELKSVILPWLNEEGKPETSAIILPTNTTPKTGAKEETPKTKKQSAAETLGLSTLKDAMGDTATVPLEDWRECFYRKHHGDSTEAKRQAFLRVRENLTSKELITVENNLYSLAESKLDSVTGVTSVTNVTPLSGLSGRDKRDTPDKILKDCLVSRHGITLGAASRELESDKDNSFKNGVNQIPDYEKF
ncbi:MAG: AAA family ATPase [Nitrospirae bacterium]|nr:AAA family ATPase [Magnetococcales bacterium]HAT50868.1 hypothetical protein [Alphaproteobacteria bacterium]